MKLEYDFTFKEFQAISTCRNRKKGFYSLRELIYWTLAAFNISFGIAMFYFMLTDANRFSIASLTLIALGIGMFLWRFVFSHMYQYWHFKQQMLQGQKVNVETLPTAVKFSTDDTITTQKWGGIFEGNEMPNHFILWISKLQAFSIPKSCFSSEEQMQVFRELVAANVTNQDIIK